MTSRNCGECGLCIFQDEGYSNYTVENTSFRCAVRAHPSGSFDRFYGENEEFSHAERCQFFQRREPIYLDVDGEVVLTPYQEIILELDSYLD